MTDGQESGYELPKQIEKKLAILARQFANQGRAGLQKLLVNSTLRIDEGSAYTSRGHGHAIYLGVPAVLYDEFHTKARDTANEICAEINDISHVDEEFIDKVVIEQADDESLVNWRQESGVLMPLSPVAVAASDEQLSRLWKSGYLKLFVTHKATFKKEALLLKRSLAEYGVSCFVAHVDIQPTEAWRDELERALFTMHGLVALMTDGFCDSEWTDQEIGVAVGRRVPIIPIRLGVDPYGFLGKYQAVSGEQDMTRQATSIYDILWKKAELKGHLAESVVARFENAQTYRHAMKLIQYVERIESAPPSLIDRLEKAPEINTQIVDDYGVVTKLKTVVTRLRGRRASR